MAVTQLIVEFLIRGEWTKSPLGMEVDAYGEDVLHEACKLMADILVGDYPGSKVRVRWLDEGSPEYIILESSDAALDDYLVEAREHQRAYAEDQRRIFREASI